MGRGGRWNTECFKKERERKLQYRELHCQPTNIDPEFFPLNLREILFLCNFFYFFPPQRPMQPQNQKIYNLPASSYQKTQHLSVSPTCLDRVDPGATSCWDVIACWMMLFSWDYTINRRLSAPHSAAM